MFINLKIRILSKDLEKKDAVVCLVILAWTNTFVKIGIIDMKQQKKILKLDDSYINIHLEYIVNGFFISIIKLVLKYLKF